MRKNIGTFLLRSLALLALLGLLMLSFGFRQHYWGPGLPIYEDGMANRWVRTERVSAADAMFLGFLFYGLLFGMALRILSRRRPWFTSLWIESLTGVCLFYILSYIGLVFTGWRCIQSLPEAARIAIQDIFMPIDRLAFFLVVPAHAHQ